MNLKGHLKQWPQIMKSEGGEWGRERVSLGWDELEYLEHPDGEGWGCFHMNSSKGWIWKDTSSRHMCIEVITDYEMKRRRMKEGKNVIGLRWVGIPVASRVKRLGVFLRELVRKDESERTPQAVTTDYERRRERVIGTFAMQRRDINLSNSSGKRIVSGIVILRARYWRFEEMGKDCLE